MRSWMPAVVWVFSNLRLLCAENGFCYQNLLLDLTCYTAVNARTFCFLLSTVQLKLAAVNSAFFFFFNAWFDFWSSLSNHWSGSSKFGSVLSLRLLRGCFCPAEAFRTENCPASFQLYLQNSVTLRCTNPWFRCEHTLAHVCISLAHAELMLDFCSKERHVIPGSTSQQHRKMVRPDNKKTPKFLNKCEGSDWVHTKLPLLYDYGILEMVPGPLSQI